MTMLRLQYSKEATIPTASKPAHAGCKTYVHRRHCYELATLDSMLAVNG